MFPYYTVPYYNILYYYCNIPYTIPYRDSYVYVRVLEPSDLILEVLWMVRASWALFWAPAPLWGIGKWAAVRSVKEMSGYVQGL